MKLLTFSSALDRTEAGNDHLNIELHVIGKELDHTSGAGTDPHHHDIVIGKEYDW